MNTGLSGWTGIGGPAILFSLIVMGANSLPANPVAPAARSIYEKTEPRTRIAILPPGAGRSISTTEADAIYGIIRETVAESPGVELASVPKIRRALESLNLDPNQLDLAASLKLGEMLKAEQVVFGQINRLPGGIEVRLSYASVSDARLLNELKWRLPADPFQFVRDSTRALLWRDRTSYPIMVSYRTKTPGTFSEGDLRREIRITLAGLDLPPGTSLDSVTARVTETGETSGWILLGCFTFGLSWFVIPAEKFTSSIELSADVHYQGSNGMRRKVFTQRAEKSHRYRITAGIAEKNAKTRELFRSLLLDLREKIGQDQQVMKRPATGPNS